jgi:hypothetical protein
MTPPVNAIARKLYTDESLGERSSGMLQRLLEIAVYDQRTPSQIYYGMTRAETVATAEQTERDVRAEQARRTKAAEDALQLR